MQLHAPANPLPEYPDFTKFEEKCDKFYKNMFEKERPKAEEEGRKQSEEMTGGNSEEKPGKKSNKRSGKKAAKKSD